MASKYVFNPFTGTFDFTVHKMKAMRVYMTSPPDQNISNDTWTTVRLDTVNFDDWTNSFNATTYRWTVPETGRYLVVCGIMWQSMPDGTDCEVRVVDITYTKGVATGVGRPGGAGYFSQREQGIAQLVKDDVFILEAYQKSGGTENIRGNEYYTFLNIALLDNLV